MKKILLFVTAFIVASSSVRAQHVQVVTDTVHYFFNKYYFKNGVHIDSFPYYKSAASTSTRVTHVGVKFLNNEPLEICGLEAFMSLHPSSTNLSVKVRMYLALLDNNGMPDTSQILDSVEVEVSGQPKYGLPKGKKFRGDTTCYTINTDFAILLRNVSLASGDTVRLMRTNGKTNGNVGATKKEKIGEGLGLVRFNGTFYSTMNFPSQLTPLHRPLAHGFSPKNNPFPMSEYTGTDYEFCIAPMVQYTLVSHHIPDESATQQLCPWEPAVYTSQSSKRFLQRQYNLVEFEKYWNADTSFAANTLSLSGQAVFQENPAICWYFPHEDCYEVQPSWVCNPPDARIFLDYRTTTNQVTFMTDSITYSQVDGSDSLLCFPHNQYRTRYKNMNIYGGGRSFDYNDTFLVCTHRCGVNMNPGLPEHMLANVRVFPNPSTGRFMVAGLGAGAVVSVYNITGQLLARKPADTSEIEVDLDDHPRGVYLVRVTQGDRWRSIRVVKE